MLGKPCRKGIRITVELILEKLAGGATVEDLLDGYPRLTVEVGRLSVRFKICSCSINQ
jgi:uncharacterized protein (DUF433 family)